MNNHVMFLKMFIETDHWNFDSDPGNRSVPYDTKFVRYIH